MRFSFLVVLLAFSLSAHAQFEDPLSDQLEDAEEELALDPEEEASFKQDDLDFGGDEQSLEDELAEELDESEVDVAEEGSESLPEELDEEIADEELADDELADEEIAEEELDEEESEELAEELEDEEGFEDLAEEELEEEAPPEEVAVEPLEEEVAQEEELEQEIDAAEEEIAEEEPFDAEVEEEPPVEPEPPAPTEPERVADNPDESTESLFHQLFVNYYNEPVDQKQWNDLVSNQSSQVYNVQRGDTLWGLSKVFFADGNFWPKIWSYNSSVTNPHQIEPGFEVRFLLGNVDSVPFIAIGPANSIGNPQVEQELAQESSTPRVPLAPVVKPVLENLPPSLPSWNKQEDDSSVLVSKRELEDSSGENLRLMSEFVMQGKGYLGEVVEIADRKLSGNLEQRVYIKSDRGTFDPGKRITVVRVGDKVKAKGKSARLNYILGEVIIEGYVERDQTRKIGSSSTLYVAKVVSSFDFIKKGARIIDMPLIYARYQSEFEPSKEIDESLNAQVLSNFGVRAYHKGKILHINQGEESGLKAGTIIPFFKKVPKSPYIKESTERLGYIKILHPEAAFSTGIVVSLKK